MSSNNKPWDGNANEGNARPSKKKSKDGTNLESQQVHKDVTPVWPSKGNDKGAEPSQEMRVESKVKNDQHPIVTVKEKSMNLTSAVQTQHPQANKTQALLHLPVTTNRQITKTYDYSKNTRRYNSRAAVFKTDEPKPSRPPIPDTWGKEPTGPIVHKRTALGSTSRDHPYTPTKRQRLINQNKNYKKEAIKSETNKNSIRDDGTIYQNVEAHINPEDEFKNLNKVTSNTSHLGEATMFRTSGTIFIPDEEEHSAEMVRFYPVSGKLSQSKSDQIRNVESRDLSADKSSLSQSVYTYDHEDVSLRHSNTPTESSLLQPDDELPSQEAMMGTRSKQPVPLVKVECESIPGSSKGPDVLILPTIKLSDSSYNLIETSDIESSDSDTSHELDPMIFKIENYSLRHSANLSPSNPRVVPFTYTRLEELEKRLRNLSGQFVSALNEDKVIVKEDETFSSTGEELISSESHQSATEQLSGLVGSSFSMRRSSNELSKISAIILDSSTITASTISFDDSSLPSYLPAFPTPAPEKKTSLTPIGSEPNVNFRIIHSTETNNEVEVAETVMNVSDSKQRQEVAADSGNRPQTSFSLVFLTLKLNSSKAEYVYIPYDIIRQSLDTLHAIFSHFLIRTSPTPLCIHINEQPKEKFTLLNLLNAVIGQMTGTFGLNLFSVIRSSFRAVISDMENVEANLEGYKKVFSAHGHMLPLISPLMEKLINPIIQMSKNNRSIILSHIDTRCEIIFPNPAHFDGDQIGLIHFFEKVVPLSEAIWTEATQLFVSSYRDLKNSIGCILQTPEPPSSVLPIPQLLNILSVTLKEPQPRLPIFKKKPGTCVLELDDILTGATVDVLGIMLPREVIQILLHPMNPPLNMVGQESKPERYDFGTGLSHYAINTTMVLLLGRRLTQSFYFGMDESTLSSRYDDQIFGCREYVINGIITCNIRSASSTIIIGVAERLPAFIQITRRLSDL